MAFGNDPQYAIGGAKNAQPVNSLGGAGKPGSVSKASVIRSMARSATRPTRETGRHDMGADSSEGRPFSAVPSRSTGFTAGKSGVRPASENSTPPFAGANSETGAAASPLASRSGQVGGKFTSPGTEDRPNAFAAGRGSMARSTAAFGTPVGTIKRRMPGVRSPKMPAALGD